MARLSEIDPPASAFPSKAQGFDDFLPQHRQRDNHREVHPRGVHQGRPLQARQFVGAHHRRPARLRQRNHRLERQLVRGRRGHGLQGARTEGRQRRSPAAATERGRDEDRVLAGRGGVEGTVPAVAYYTEHQLRRACRTGAGGDADGGECGRWLQCEPAVWIAQGSGGECWFDDDYRGRESGKGYEFRDTIRAGVGLSDTNGEYWSARTKRRYDYHKGNI